MLACGEDGHRPIRRRMDRRWHSPLHDCGDRASSLLRRLNRMPVCKVSAACCGPVPASHIAPLLTIPRGQIDTARAILDQTLTDCADRPRRH